MEVLSESGVTVDELAKRLGVTRGSFYQHFESRKELSQEILTFWAQRWTIEICDDIFALDLDGYNSLRSLILMIHHRQAANYDVAFRSWALHDSLARQVVKIWMKSARSLFLYYAMTEPAFFAPPDKETEARLVEERLKFLTSGM